MMCAVHRVQHRGGWEMPWVPTEDVQINGGTEGQGQTRRAILVRFSGFKVFRLKNSTPDWFTLSVVGCWDSFFQYKSPSHRILVQKKPAEPSHRKRKNSAPNERIPKRWKSYPIQRHLDWYPSSPCISCLNSLFQMYQEAEKIPPITRDAIYIFTSSVSTYKSKARWEVRPHAGWARSNLD